MSDLKLNTLSLLWVARETRKHYSKRGCVSTRREIADCVRAYRRCNPAAAVRRAYQSGDFLYGRYI